MELVPTARSWYQQRGAGLQAASLLCRDIWGGGQPEQLLQQVWGVFAPPGQRSVCVSVVGSRKLEEQLRLALQREEARLEQRKAQMQQNQELLFVIESGTNKLFADLHGITVPGQVPVWCWGEHGPSRCLVVQWHSTVSLGAGTITPRGSFASPVLSSPSDCRKIPSRPRAWRRSSGAADRSCST